jgi:hypothetical protein
MLTGGENRALTEEPGSNEFGSYLSELVVTFTCADCAFFESLMSLARMAKKPLMATMMANEVTKISMTFILLSEKFTALNHYSLTFPVWISGIVNPGLAVDLPVQF